MCVLAHVAWPIYEAHVMSTIYPTLWGGEEQGVENKVAKKIKCCN
jgi:hypothetical protein